MSEQLLSYAQVAKRLGITVGGVSKLVRRGLIPAVRLSPILVRIKESELERVLTELSTDSTAKDGSNSGPKA